MVSTEDIDRFSGIPIYTHDIIRGENYTVTARGISGVSFSCIGEISFSNTMKDLGVEKDVFYHGCKQCYDYSQSFGGRIYNFTEEDKLNDCVDEFDPCMSVTEEADYEKLKTLFVTHFNIHHKDLVKNRKKGIGVYKLVKDDDIDIVLKRENINNARIIEEYEKQQKVSKNRAIMGESPISAARDIARRYTD